MNRFSLPSVKPFFLVLRLLKILLLWEWLILFSMAQSNVREQQDSLWIPADSVEVMNDLSIIAGDTLKEKACYRTMDSLKQAWQSEQQWREMELKQLRLQIELLQRDVKEQKDSVKLLTNIIRYQEDSLMRLKMFLARKQEQVAALKIDSVANQQQYKDLSLKHKMLQDKNDTLKLQNISAQRQLNEKNLMLERQIAILKEKEEIFAEKELLYKEAISTSDIDKAKLTGSLDLKDESLRGKEREIAYLQKSINEKDSALLNRNRSVEELIAEKNRYYKLSDTLQKKLTESEKKLLQINEELKYTQRRAKEAEEKIAMATHRKKKVRVIQGLGMKLYRTPVWDMMPISQEGTYVNSIVNRNAGWAEFDFVTGASVMLIDLSSDSSRFSSDLGVYVGFGGSNLFKNFYVGLNYKFLDFFHVAVGVNIAEYKVLASGYQEGDVLPVGIAIQTVNEWKVKPFISFSVDLDFLSYMGKR